MSLKSLDDWNEQVVHVAVAPMHVAVLLLHPPEQPSHLEKRHKNTSGCSIVGQYKSMASPNHLSFCTNSFTEILLKGFLNDQLQWHKPTPVTWGVPWFEETAMLCWHLYTLTCALNPSTFHAWGRSASTVAVASSTSSVRKHPRFCRKPKLESCDGLRSYANCSIVSRTYKQKSATSMHLFTCTTKFS